MRKLLFVLAMLFSIMALKAQTPGCKILHKGTFQYYENPIVDTTVVVKFKGNKKYEYNPAKGQTIVSKIEWINECEYTSTFIKAIGKQKEGVLLPKGNVLHVTITNVTGNIISFTFTGGLITMSGKFKKIK